MLRIKINIDECYRIMKNNKDVKDKVIRWGSIFKAKTIEELSELLGDDLLTPEEKEKFLEAVREANRDEELLKAWERDKDKYLRD